MFLIILLILLLKYVYQVSSFKKANQLDGKTDQCSQCMFTMHVHNACSMNIVHLCVFFKYSALTADWLLGKSSLCLAWWRHFWSVDIGALHL